MFTKRIFNRREFLVGLGASVTTGTFILGKDEIKRRQILALDDPNYECIKDPGDKSLKQLAAEKNILFGTAIRHPLLSDEQYTQTLIEECSILVPEWALKWHVNPNPLRPTPYSFDFTAADKLFDFAGKHNIQVRGHALVWHISLPPWFEDTVNKENARNFLEKHIKTVLGHYRGQIHSWDVVNEAIEIRDGHPNGLRKTPWLEFLGEDYIDLAFRLAHEADPKAMLVYNDYGLDYDIAEDEAKRDAVIKLLKRLKSKGTPIHAFGMQAHLSGEETNFNPNILKDFFAQIADMGLKILITELDVIDNKLPKDIKIRDRIVAKVYSEYLKVSLEQPAVIAVLTWGLNDKYSWVNEFNPREDKAQVRPLPIDINGQRKLAWNAIARAFDEAKKR